MLPFLQKLLEESGHLTILEKATGDSLNDRLLFIFKNPYNAQDCLLEITAHPQSFQANEDYFLIQFQSILAIPLQPSTFNQISSALHFFNRMLHCPGFELDEASDQVIFRYAWFIKKSGIDAKLLMQVVGNIQLSINMFTPYLKEIAEGKYTLEDILKEVMALKPFE